MLSVTALVALHDQLTEAAHQSDRSALSLPEEWLGRVARQHMANFDLWHIEDEARNPLASDADLAQVKRRIDRTNQLRNDLAEQLDLTLLGWLEPQSLPRAGVPLHSESPGLIIDRLSILALKIYHTREETLRRDAPTGHQERNQGRLAMLTEQRSDLAACLDELWSQTLAGNRRFKLYRQFKMYNDPTLNPVLYAQSGSGNRS
ncbi:DUF4254 domain-containing protein [Telmatobacter bradus]|uniref:DUF4254 domain-containing protein n=1 Tax=Telmatobacter bradus TaxID=474953 RepID=UPI003B434DDD